MDSTNELLAEQQKTNKLLALLVTKGLNQTEKILALSQVGFRPTEIANLIDTTPNSVSVSIAKNKKKGKK